MARISTIGADRVALKLETQSKQGKLKARAMMYEGANIVIAELRDQLLKYGYNGGILYDNLASTNYRSDSDGAKIDITFRGEQVRTGKRTGKVTKTRNAAIGFIQQYGRKYGVKKVTHRAGRPYFTDAVKYSRPDVIDKWTEMMHDDN